MTPTRHPKRPRIVLHGWVSAPLGGMTEHSGHVDRVSIFERRPNAMFSRATVTIAYDEAPKPMRSKTWQFDGAPPQPPP